MAFTQLTAFSYHAFQNQDPRFQTITTPEGFEALIRRLEDTPVRSFDTETNGTAWYQHARICGVSFGVREGTAYRSFYVPFRHRTGEPQLSEHVVGPALKRVLADPYKLTICHNIKFDDHMIRREGWSFGGATDDTMIRARLYDETQSAKLKHRALVDLGDKDAHLHEELLDREVARLARLNGMPKKSYKDLHGFSQIPIFQCGLYAGYDAEATYRLHELYGQIPTRFPRIYPTEIYLARVLCDVEEFGVPIDLEYLERLRVELQNQKAQLENQIWDAFGHHQKFELSEDDQLRFFLTRKLGLQLWKKTRGGKMSVDREVLEFYAEEVQALRLILEWREATKLESTYTDSIIERLDANNVLHCDFQQLGTTSGRASAKEPNLQNIPSDSDRRALVSSGRKLKDGGVDPWSIRNAFTNRGPGWVRIYLDYCVTGDTRVVTSKGLKAIQDVRAGDHVLASSAKGDLAMKAVTRQARIGVCPVFRLTLEDGTSVRCTGDHKWMRRDGMLVKTKELKAGDRLMHVRSGMGGRYPTWWVRSNRAYSYKHILVARAVLGPAPQGSEVDHMDHDPLNWGARRNNHCVVSVEECGAEAVYQITVDDFHTYVLENGLVSANSQIELRVIAHYSRDPVLTEAYLTGQDVHTRTSLEVFGTDDPAMRRPSKVLAFGLSYCLSAKGFARQARMSEEEAEKHYRRFFERYAGIPRLREHFWKHVRENGGRFQNLFGRERHIPEINNPNHFERTRAERQAIGALIQGTAAELTKESLCRIHKWLRSENLPAEICQTIHDEIQIDTPVEYFARVASGAKWLMEHFPEFAPIPIIAEPAYSTESWAKKQSISGI